MKTLLVGINSKFIHSNLAIRYIQKYGAGQGVSMDIAEYTINQSIDYILDEILLHSADVIGFSCYLWNIDYVQRLVTEIRKVSPNVLVIVGGPEVSYDSHHWIDGVDGIDFVVNGEGEHTTIELIKAIDAMMIQEENHSLDQGKSQLENRVYRPDYELLNTLKGITYRKEGNSIQNPQGLAMDMALVPFVYDEIMEGLDHRIIYYETSRGCPYSCEYCLSSIEKGVRFRPLEMVYQELQFFLDQKVMQVKFVDRTFNARKSHAMGIWQYLRENDNGYTNFHFEMTADVLDSEMIDFLKTLRTGLVQFEIGVQSTNEDTIVDMQRKTDFDMIKRRVEEIKEGHNIHLHLDLIAGLPKEDYRSFTKSFDDVMAIRPEQLQLGFLKVLKGSAIYDKREAYGLVYRTYPPYEILSTADMTYNDLRDLKQVEELLEIYYNSGQFVESVEYAMSCYESTFDFYESFAKYWEDKGLYHLKHTRVKMYDVLYDYACASKGIDEAFIKDLLIHDLCSKEKQKKWPEFEQRPDGTSDAIKGFYKKEEHMTAYFHRYEGYNLRQIQRMTHIESFDYDILLWREKRMIKKCEQGAYLFYDYKGKDPMTGIGSISKVII